ncbi:MAG: hypothetical protein ACXVCY_08960 [Pseudobdellovibrionaceae bacterium]
MKIMIPFILSLFIGTTSWSHGPVDPITPPWPLRTLPVNKVEFPGRWVGVYWNTLWVVEVDPNISEDGRSNILIKSNANSIRFASGWLTEQKDVFVGKAVEGDSTFNIMIFRDDEGTKLRIAGTNRYFDLKLYKSQ